MTAREALDSICRGGRIREAVILTLCEIGVVDHVATEVSKTLENVLTFGDGEILRVDTEIVFSITADVSAWRLTVEM